MSHFLNYLLLEDYCSDVDLLQKSLSNMTPCDYLQVIYTLPPSWTDIPAVKLNSQFGLGNDEMEPESLLPERPSLSQIMSQHELKSRISKCGGGEQPSQ